MPDFAPNFAFLKRKKDQIDPKATRKWAAGTVKFGEYPRNTIRTSKYTPITFLPLNLYEQFKRFSNVYFFIIMVISFIPSIAPVSPITSILPLVFVLGVTAVKEAYEDTKRHRSDRRVNHRKGERLEGTSFAEVAWADMRVGEIIRIKENQEIPADVIVLNSSGEDGVAMVETSNLDGETNLKMKYALPFTRNLATEADLKEWLSGNIVVETEAPNTNLYKFDGTMAINGETHPINIQQLLLRGCKLKNIDWVYGLVVFTGYDTRLILNAKKPRFKLSSFERVLMNRTVLFLFAVLACIVLIAAGLGAAFYRPDHYYLDLTAGAGRTFGAGLGTFVILFSVFIPISLFVTMEIVKLWLSFFIMEDLEMYDEDQGVRAKARNFSLIEELGRIQYVFADKTGTLTINHMQFAKCSVGGRIYDTFERGPLDEFYTLLAVCHDIIPEIKSKKKEQPTELESEPGTPKHKKLFHHKKKMDKISPSSPLIHNRDLAVIKNEGASSSPRLRNSQHQVNATIVTEIPATMEAEPTPPSTQHMIPNKENIIYRATSEDERALVEEAKERGFFFKKRDTHGILVEIYGQEQRFQILNTLAFDSFRKRMSVVCRTPSGQIRVYAKGADAVMLERLKPGQDNLVKPTVEHMQQFSESGLRTLVMAYKDLSEADYHRWHEKFKAASLSLDDREGKLAEVAEEIETNLTLIGASAILDELQDQVAETIALLKRAGMKVWVLTGDKVETAINVGYSASLLTSTSKLSVIDNDDRQETMALFENMIKSEKESPSENPAIVIGGKSLSYALAEFPEKILEVTNVSKTVIIARISPLHKAEIVKLVKNNNKHVQTLAIGDGANDVSMIQEAHVGVGIKGREGTQAAMASDYSISKFRYLSRLLLVHGRWGYKRLSKLVLYSFFKNLTFVLPMFWFQFYAQGSGQTIYEDWSLSLYNTIFTFLPVVVLGLLEQDVRPSSMYKYPELYETGPRNDEFNVKLVILWTIEAFYCSLVIFFGTYLIFGEGIIHHDGKSYGIWSFGLISYTTALFIISFKILVESKYITFWLVGAVFLSLLLWFLWIILFSAVQAAQASILFDYSYLFGVSFNLMITPLFWLAIVVLTLVALLPGLIFKFLKRYFFPSHFQIVQELEHQEHCARHARKASNTKELKAV
eukprot:TRINITY_DN5979_c0_g1_i1.p1 TRINITY_DN5979_c0_g1~~TRINITY_DN5979_c0_g1_i1.p1  ORF type:complete len:1154 (-),score=316.94 TRINITY_DN5979_c0_g1_i1:278-3739(-)